MPAMRTPEGAVVWVPDDQVTHASDNGYTTASEDDVSSAVSDREKSGGGVGGAITAGVGSALSGATLGLSDVVAGAALPAGSVQAIADAREQHPIVSGVANVAGAVVPGLLSGGASLPESGVQSIARMSPSAFVSRQAARIAAAGAEDGLAGKVAGGVLGGTYEGAAQMAGNYVSDVALGNRELSAEGFVGSLNSGALLGGAIGGGGAFAEAGLSKVAGGVKKLIGKAGEEGATIADEFGGGLDSIPGMTDEDAAAAKALDIEEPGGKGWTPTRKLFPAHEATADATKAAESAFQDELDQMTKDSVVLEKTAKQKLEELRLQKMQSDVATREHLGKLKVEQAEARVHAQKEVAATRAAQREAAELRLAKQKGGAPNAPDVPADAPAEPMTGHPDAPTDLERQLAATKQKLDEGTPLGTLSGSDRGLEHSADDGILAATEPHIERKVDEFIAAGDPEYRRLRDATDNLTAARGRLDSWLEKYGGKQGNVGRFERSEAAREYAAGLRPKESGYYTRGPAGEDRSNVLVQRGYQKEFRGTEAERDVADTEFVKRYAGGRTLEQHIADGNVGASQSTSFERSGRSVAEATPDEVADISAHQAAERRQAAEDLRARMTKRISSPASEGVPAALREGVVDAAARAAVDVGGMAAGSLTQKLAAHSTVDVAEAIDVLGNYERAVHDVMQVVKPEIPVPAASRSAEGMADALAKQDAAHVTQATNAAEHTAEAMARPETRAAVEDTRGAMTVEPHWQADVLHDGATAPTSVSARGGKLLKQAKDLGTVLEVLKTMGVGGIPDPSSIPVIGPLLGLYLKARAAATVFKRLGGKVPTTIETKIATRAAAMRTRAVAAVENVVSGGVKAGRESSIPTATQILKQKLLAKGDDNDEPSRGASAERRIAELADYVTNRGSYLAQLTRSLPTKNPDISQAVADAFDRKMSYLESKAPKDPRPASLVKSKWSIPPGQLESFARAVRAVQDPGSVFDDLEHGRCTPESADAIREVYPNLFMEAQRALVSKAPELLDALSYAKRQTLSALFRVPLDVTQTPEYLSWISAPSGAGSPASTSQPGSQPVPGTPPQPGIVADVSLSRSVDPFAGRRAQR